MVGIIDYGMGNLQSVRNACEYLGEEVLIARTPSDLFKVNRMILPGVGAFSEGMKNLVSRNLETPIKDRIQKDKVPLLGICLGMQLLADIGTEGGKTTGLGLIPGTIERLADKKVRLPHIGWNDIRLERSGHYFTQEMAVDYYFIHSYYFRVESSHDIVATCTYGQDFPSIVERGVVSGVQFHPEKSHRFGLELLKKFLQQPC